MKMKNKITEDNGGNEGEGLHGLRMSPLPAPFPLFPSVQFFGPGYLLYGHRGMGGQSSKDQAPTSSEAPNSNAQN
ncbi:MAG: hypothetical protein P4N60_07170 [Verrucomicrobiae bacterium]|nr:hypothetical protein [Verrucomicrobiae bacterium]